MTPFANYACYASRRRSCPHPGSATTPGVSRAGLRDAVGPWLTLCRKSREGTLAMIGHKGDTGEPYRKSGRGVFKCGATCVRSTRMTK